MNEKNPEKRRVINADKVIELSQTIACKEDPDGSYTGVPIHPGETPVQDADDL